MVTTADCTTFKLFVDELNYQCVADCPTNYANDVFACQVITSCSSFELPLLGSDHTVECIADCPNHILKDDNKTCIAGAAACTFYQQIVIRENYRCLEECLSELVDIASSACVASCSGFTETIGVKTTRSCVVDCSSGFATLADKHCLDSCDTATSFKKLIQSNTFECLTDCPTNKVQSADNITCDADSTPCVYFHTFVKSSATYYCEDNCATLLADGSSACIESCATFLENITDKTTHTCVTECSSSFVDPATKVCLASCADGVFAELIPDTSKYYCVENCASY